MEWEHKLLQKSICMLNPTFVLIEAESVINCMIRAQTLSPILSLIENCCYRYLTVVHSGNNPL